MRHRNNDPRILNARFKGVCKETGKTIQKGQQCLYEPLTRSVYHMDSKRAQEWNEIQMDDWL